MIASDQVERLGRRVEANRACAGVDFTQLIELAVSVRPGESILDVGCGSGHILALLARGNGGAPALGIEVQAESVRQANEAFQKQGLRHARAVVYDASRVPFSPEGVPLEDASFDLALSTSALYNIGRNNSADTVTPGHAASIRSAIAELDRVLKQGGRLIVNSPTPRNTDDLVRVARRAGADNARAFRQIRLPEIVTGEVLLPALLSTFDEVAIAHVRNPVRFDEERLDLLVGYFLASDFWTNKELLPAGLTRSEYLTNIVHSLGYEIRKHGSFVVRKDFLLFCCRKGGTRPANEALSRVISEYPENIREVTPGEAESLARKT